MASFRDQRDYNNIDKMKLHCIQNVLSRYFSSLGRIIAKHPYYFLIGTVLLTSIFSSGLLTIKINRDLNYLFTAKNGRAQSNKNLAEVTFPMNTSTFSDMARITKIKSVVIIQATAKDGGSVLRSKVVEEIARLDAIVKNITVKWNNKIYKHKDLCGKRNGKCLETTFHNLIPFSKQILAGKYKIKYPIHMNNLTLSYEEYVLSLGGVELDSQGFVKDVKAARFIYLSDVSNSSKEELIQLWREAVNEKLISLQFSEICISFFNDNYLLQEVNTIAKYLLKRIPIAAVTVISFSFLCCMTNNWIRSKPWLGPSACISAGLAIISGFGLVSYLGIEYTDFNIGLCFIILGTEIDDAFVMISAWRNTPVTDSVEKRLQKVYTEAGVSITITSLTNFISFCVGIAAQFPVVELFCSYAAASIFFSYIYQITFFGACMALSGYREEKNLHSLTFCPIKNARARQGNLSQIKESYKEEEFLMAQFRDKIGHLLTFPKTKIIVIILLFLNLGIGIWGFIFIKKGNEFSDLLSDNSSINIYNEQFFKYFNKYYYPVHIIIDQPLNYADKDIQNSLEYILNTFEAHPNVADSSLRISWLKYYKMFADMPVGKFSLRGYNMSDKQDFINGLRDVFLRIPQAREFQEDIIFNENFTDITTSRILILLKDITDQDVEVKVIKDLYHIADKSPISIKLHSVVFHLIEQAIIIENMVYQTILISSALVCLVFFLFVPNITCALSISTIVLCIICETVGYVYFFNVKMDILLLYALILCVGFSINYPTHISFSFVVAKNISSKERIKKCIYEIGFPILQGICTTILAIAVLPFEPFYIAVSFFKIMTVLSLQTVWHAMFVIPVILSLLQHCDKSLAHQIPSKDSINDLDVQEALTQNSIESKYEECRL
ncbi:patched domain-containing protein 3-like isoform X1 [Centruroides vittatus]|uniref:patched domain-containing protein 3-like isoform X1 n=2 Tax=Centruroides vittatus TaxID=120091 RepID=UPI0035109072